MVPQPVSKITGTEEFIFLYIFQQCHAFFARRFNRKIKVEYDQRNLFLTKRA